VSDQQGLTETRTGSNSSYRGGRTPRVLADPLALPQITVKRLSQQGYGHQGERLPDQLRVGPGQLRTILPTVQ
jgi:hypothetical protein